MAPKQQLEKQAWQWAESTEPSAVNKDHVETAYRIHLKPCKTSCRRNCAGNPWCLNGLGEREWLQEIDDSYWHDIDDPNNERRKEGSYVGLKNLGATCYVNTFLQVWYHNPEFRQALFTWREDEDDIPFHLDAPKTGENGAKMSETKLIESSSEIPQESQNIKIGCMTKQENLQSMAPPAEWENQLLPSSVCGHLRLIFALLQFSKRRYIDPDHFIKFLGLDAGQQQDAQEFSKLLMSLLEDSLTQKSGDNLIQQQFGGSYNYVTQCKNCGRGSPRPSQFFELDLNIKGHKDLLECISEFLQEEKLEGDNQYFCEHCNSKQNAIRRIEMKSLPQVLNMQLLRFVFERKTGHKKKLNTYIQFPETLDMSKYVGKPEGEYVYSLSAVLIHRGPSAYSGHYVAHIQDRSSEDWYKFNDEDIEKMGGKNLQLGNEEDVEGKGSKKPRTVKGHHASRNAYMLVYRRKFGDQKFAPVAETDLSMLPQRVQKYVELDNMRFEDWITEMSQMREKNVEVGRCRQEEVRTLYKMMGVSSVGCEPYELISTRWLQDWTRAEKVERVPPVDNSKLTCSHCKLHPDKVAKVKCISQSAAEIIYSKYSGGPRLKSDSFCWDCVKARCHVIRTKAKIKEDSKIISEILKAKQLQLDPSDSYWIGKRSLRSWKRLVLENLDDPTEQNGMSNTPIKDTPIKDRRKSDCTSMDTESESCNDPAQSKDPLRPGENTKEIQGEEKTSKIQGEGEIQGGGKTLEIQGGGKTPEFQGDEVEEEEESLNFNEDLLCELHDKLSPDEGCRRLIPGEVWRRLKSYFSDVADFSGTSPVCEQCLLADEVANQKLVLNKSLASSQKLALCDLYNDRNRPVWKKGTCELCVISEHFLEQWRSFIKDPVQNEPLREVGNRALLCDHGGFLQEPSTIGLSQSSLGLVFIWVHEWEALKQHVEVDVEIRVTRIEEEDGPVTVLVSPDVCEECCRARLAAERKALLEYDTATIYIRKLMEDKGSGQSGSQDSNYSLTSENSQDKDTEFLQENGKRKKGGGGGGPSEKAAKVEMIGGTRRSSRHRRLRGEKQVTVSSKMKLLQLKVEVMKLFSATPMDQHLMLDGEELTGNERTLSSLNITPGCVLYLKVDEPCDDPTFYEDVDKAQKPEEGFKGTGLLGR